MFLTDNIYIMQRSEKKKNEAKKTKTEAVHHMNTPLWSDTQSKNKMQTSVELYAKQHHHLCSIGELVTSKTKQKYEATKPSQMQCKEFKRDKSVLTISLRLLYKCV